MTLRRDTRELLDEDPEFFGRILARMMGELDEVGGMPAKPPSPYEVCREMGLSYGALLGWVARDEGRKDEFNRMLEIRAHLYAEQMVPLADGEMELAQEEVKRRLEEAIAGGDASDEAIDGLLRQIAAMTKTDARVKLMMEARRFVASKWDRKRYGEHAPPAVSVSLTIGDAAVELEALETRLGLRQPRVIEHEGVGALPAPEKRGEGSPAGGGIETPAAGAAVLPLGRDPASPKHVEVSEEYPEL